MSYVCASSIAWDIPMNSAAMLPKKRATATISAGMRSQGHALTNGNVSECGRATLTYMWEYCILRAL